MRPTLLRLRLLLIITPAHAQMEISVKADVITLKGINLRFECDELWLHLKRLPNVTTVALSSKGGDTKAARCAGQLIRKYKLNTVVLDHCMGACVSMWLGGVERTLSGANSTIILMPSIPNEQDAKFDPGHIKIQREWLPAIAPKIDLQMMEQWINLPLGRYIRFYQNRAEICENKECKTLPNLNLVSAGLATK